MDLTSRDPVRGRPKLTVGRQMTASGQVPSSRLGRDGSAVLLRSFDLAAQGRGPSGARPVGALATLRRLALFVTTGIEPLAAVPSCGSPWRQPRNPARHITPKDLVLHAECLPERRFFDHHHPDMKKEPE